MVYRGPIAPGALAGSSAAASAPAPDPDPDWCQVAAPDEVLLFRYSALTFNAHRIHYDKGYATNVEGYTGTARARPADRHADAGSPAATIARRHRPGVRVSRGQPGRLPLPAYALRGARRGRQVLPGMGTRRRSSALHGGARRDRLTHGIGANWPQGALVRCASKGCSEYLGRRSAVFAPLLCAGIIGAFLSDPTDMLPVSRERPRSKSSLTANKFRRTHDHR